MGGCVPDDVLLDYVQRRLAPAEAAVVDRHVAGCATCRRAAEELGVLAGPVTDELPGPDVDAAVAGLIRSYAPRPRRMARRLVAVAAALLVAAGGWLLVRTPAPGTTTATLTAVGPDVRVTTPAGEVPAVAGMALHPADTVTVPAGSSAVVAFGPETAAELGPDTAIALAADGTLEVRQGLVEVAADTPLAVRTGQAAATVRRTRFTLAADAVRTSLRVAAGVVHLTRHADGAAVDVAAGQRSSVTADGPMGASPGRTGTVLLIVSDDHAPPTWARFNELLGEKLVGTRLRRLAFPVEVVGHRDLRPEHLADRPVVVVSVAHEDVGYEDSLRRAGVPAAAVPVVCLEPVAFPPLGLTGPARGTDFDWGTGMPAGVDLPDPADPWLRGAVGLDRLAGQLGGIGWARPGPAARRVATVPGDGARAVAFAYEAGAATAAGPAPARRAGLFLNPDTLGEADEPGWAVFEAAVEWAAEPTGR